MYNPIRSSVFTLVFFLFAGLLLAQNYSQPIHAPRLANDAATQRMMCNSDAGVIENFGPFIGVSTDRGPDTIFLCLGDSVFVNHDDLSVDFSGDPAPATPAGIGYIPYRCQPTIAGPTIADVAADPCIANNGVFPPNGGIGFYVYTGQPNNLLSGDAWFFNDGSVQAFFPNMGSPDPIVLWQTPATFDRITTGTVLAEYERDAMNVLGPCINVATDQSFAVAYLNGITVADVNLAGCSGSFRVRGGAPELLGGGYFIEARLTTDPAVVAVVNSAGVTHDGFVTFEVPQPGNYEITIRDDKSCPATRIVTMDNCDAVTFNAPFENHLPGESFCVPVTTAGFDEVLSFQYTINYDPTVLTYTGAQNINPQIASLFLNGPPSSGGNQAPGVIRAVYSSPAALPESIANGEVLYELCFTAAIGQLGECSPIAFGSNPLPALVTVEDSMGGAADSGFDLNAGAICLSTDPYFVGLTQDSLSCPGASDGCLNVTVAGGTAPYTVRYRRLNPIPSGFFGPDALSNETDNITYCGLIAGNYEVEVLDAAAQVIFDTIRVIEPIGFGVNVVTVSPTCFGLEDGTARAVIRIGTNVVANPIAAGYLFSWNTTTLNIDSLTDLTAEDFVGVTVTSPNGCVSPFVSGTVSPVTELEIRPTQEELAVDPATCAGSFDGSITVSAQGGTPGMNGYRFVWSHGPDAFSPTSVTVNGLDPASYTVTVTDGNGCVEQATYQVTAVKELSFVGLISQIDCAGDSDGEIFVTGNTVINDPTETPDIPYTFTWSANAPVPVQTATTTQITALGPGNYFITMTDTEGCMADTLFTVVEPAPLVITDVITLGESCNVGNDGSATVVVTGGTLPYTFSWSNAPMDTDSIAQGLSASTNNRILVTDANGCTQEAFFDILAPTPPQITQFNDDFVSCPDATDGELTVVAIPGGAPITQYSWAGPNGPLGSGPMTTSRSNLAPGTYYVTITDQNDCFVVDSAVVSSPGLVVLDSLQLGLPTCVGDSDGRIRLFPNAGTPPYTFTWSTNPNVPGTVNPLTGLAAGTYSVTIQDSEGCEPLVQTIVLPDPPSIVANFTNIIDVTCPDNTTCDGSATVGAMYSDGTNGSFNFVWRIEPNGAPLLTETGLTSSSLAALCRGDLFVDISDGSCGITADTIVGSPAEIVIGVTVENVSCFQEVDGEITLNPMGGTAPFDFFWQETGGVTNMETGLAAGLYNIIVTDANGCARAQAAEVTEPTQLVLEIDPTRTTPTVQCADDENGTIGVRVTDPNGINPLLPAPYTWQNGVAAPGSSLAENLAAGTYSVTVTDIKGCTDDLQFTIGNPPPIVFSVLPIEEPLCFGETTLVLIDTAFGGSGQTIEDFSFSVNNDGFRIPATQAGSTFAGQTVVTVFDDSGCSVRDTFSVNQPPPILVDLPESIVIELGDSLTVLNPIISPAGDIYDYRWTPAEFLSSDTVRSPTIFPFENRDYTLVVTNANGCQAFADIFVEVDANRNVYIPNVFSPNRDGRNEDFRIYACQGVQSVNFVRVFDRWGSQLYEQDNIDPNCLDGIRLWDGTFRGKPVDPGVFVYMIEVEFLDGATLLYRGDITVLR